MLAALKLYEATSIATESDDPELLPQMQLISQAAQLLTLLLKAAAGQFPDHDRLANSLLKVGLTLDRHSQDADPWGPEISHATSWPSLSEGSGTWRMLREAWPTPTAAAWLEKSTIAVKALFTLRWLNKPEQLRKLADETPEDMLSTAENRPVSTAAYHAVGESLLQLLHCCLAGEHTAHWAPLQQSAIKVPTMSCLSWLQVFCRFTLACIIAAVSTLQVVASKPDVLDTCLLSCHRHMPAVMS